MYWLALILILPYFFLILRIFKNLSNIKPFLAVSDPLTKVSVVVACYNEERNLPMLLQCIDNQKYSKELLEIIIVNDNSTDRTFDVSSEFRGKNKMIVLQNEGKGKKQAIRTGIKASSGKLIITTDADCLMGEKWLQTITCYFEKYKPNMIISPVQLKPVSGFFGRFQELEFLSLQGITTGTCLRGEPTMCNGANLSFTREAYLRHRNDLHDEINSGEDIFLLHALKRDKDSEVLWLESTDAIVAAAASPTIGTYLNQRKRWISKVGYYDDQYTSLLGIITFITNFTVISVLVTGIFIPQLLLVFLAAFLLKSVPDYLILRNVTKRYGKINLLAWFIPSQLLYPFYVLGVAFYAIMSSNSQRQ
jgi:glycosyltransferase involved in cell wall biosynthesis